MNRLAVSCCVLLLLADPVDAVDVDLTFSPATQTVSAGDTVDVQLFASAAGILSQAVIAIDVILIWDPQKLALEEIVGDDGYSWFVSDFLADPGAINDDLTDGDALYTALTAPGTPASVPPDPGLHVTTFRFTALEDTPSTEVDMLPMLGPYALTQVLYLLAEDVTGDTSSVAEVVIGSTDTAFERGDANNDGSINIADAIWNLNYLFQDLAPPSCLDAGDMNDDGSINIADAIYLMAWQFAEGPALPPPFGSCGFDATADSLDCAIYSHCP